MPLTIDGDQVREVTIDGSLVRALTIDGSIVFDTVESFEDGDISEYSDETGSYSVTTTSPYNGSHRLEGTTPTGGGGVTIRSTSGLGTYPAPGDTFRMVFQIHESDQLVAFLFGAQSGNTGISEAYRVEHSQDGTVFSLHEKTGGTDSILARDMTASVTLDGWAEIKVDWASDNTITCTLFDTDGSQVSQISATDSTFTDGGIGFRSFDFNDQSTMEWDYVRFV